MQNMFGSEVPNVIWASKEMNLILAKALKTFAKENCVIEEKSGVIFTGWTTRTGKSIAPKVVTTGNVTRIHHFYDKTFMSACREWSIKETYV